MDVKPPRRRSLKIKSVPSLRSVADRPLLPIQVRSSQRLKALIVTSFGVLLLASTLSTLGWYHWAIDARSSESKPVRIVVQPGDTAATIASTLYEHEIIRSRLGFGMYAQLNGVRDKLQAGGYVFSPDQRVPDIVEHMVAGKTDEFTFTVPPGLTLDELRSRFKVAGFSDNEITAAFNATYDHPLLATRPAGASLEGYIYPETYRINADDTLQNFFERTFDELYTSLQEKKYLEAFAGHGLTIHQALTLSSIVQKEVTEPTDQKQVAQVFLKRLAEDMPLGSDVTYIYAAKQLGVRATPSLDSPYNTRKHAGLPPGPISTMNPSALEAVAFPAAGDYLYFVAGDRDDEGKTFFARTNEEHEANIAAHCHELCQ